MIYSWTLPFNKSKPNLGWLDHKRLHRENYYQEEGGNSHPLCGEHRGRKRKTGIGEWKVRDVCPDCCKLLVREIEETPKVGDRLQTPFWFGVLGWEASWDTCPGTDFLSIEAERRPAVSYPESSWHSLDFLDTLGRKSWPWRGVLGGHSGWSQTGVAARP